MVARPPEASDATADFFVEAAQFREVLTAGRSTVILKLFDFLIARSKDERAPKEVEIALALFYGTNAAAGVINVVTRGYTDAPDGMITIGADTNKSFRADAYVRGRAGPGNFVGYASRDRSEGFRAYDNAQPSAEDQKRGYDFTSYGAKYRLELRETLSIDARYQHNDADLDYLNFNRTVFAENNRDEEIASLGVNFEISADLAVQAKGYWHDWDTRYTSILNDLSTPAPHEAVVIDDNAYWGYEDKGINALAEFTPGGPFEYVLGYDFQTYSARDDVWNIEPTEENVQAYFGQVRTSSGLIENAAFAAGVRHNDTGGATSTVWNVSGRYEVTPSLYAHGTLGTSFLLPNAEQLFVIEQFWYLGNPNVEPEESANLNLALGGQFQTDAAFSWQATYFAHDIENLIDGVDFATAGIDTSLPYRGLNISGDDPNTPTPNDGPQYDGVFYNVDGTVEVRGIELTGSAEFGFGLAILVSYTHTDSTIEGYDEQIQTIPVDIAKVSAQYESPNFGGVAANLLWVGDQFRHAGSFGRVNYGDYAVLDLSARLYLDAEERHKLTFRLQNALDEAYATQVTAGMADAGGAILVANRGVPQTLHVTYSLQF